MLDNGANSHTEDDWGNTPIDWTLEYHAWHGHIEDFGSVVKAKLSVLIPSGVPVKPYDLDILSEQAYGGKDQIQQWLEQTLAGVILEFLE